MSGMTCAACARAIERTLADVPGVDRASVNFATSTATVEYNAKIARPDEFVASIQKLGYRRREPCLGLPGALHHREHRHRAPISPGLTGIPDAIELARRTMRIIRQNLVRAFAYNALGIPIAALGLLSPMVASQAMAHSSLTVVMNSLRLK